MLIFDIAEVKERFEELVEKAAAGEPFEIYENGRPMVKVTAYRPGDDISQPAEQLTRD